MNRKDGWKFFALALVAGLMGGVLSNRYLPHPAQVQQVKVVEAGEINIVDKKGETRAFLRLTSYGDPKLVLADKNGMARVIMGIWSDGEPKLALADEDGMPRVILSLSPDG
ncbi:hypothetical protein IIA15_02655, partial [candidate division TA06 bacterium]|nr:hypothetical protein [candidate division TA06 bacterium]